MVAEALKKGTEGSCDISTACMREYEYALELFLPCPEELLE
jgi:hypothetical protein